MLCAIGVLLADPAAAQRKLTWKPIDATASKLKVAGEQLGMRASVLEAGRTDDYLIQCHHQGWQGNGQQLEAVLCALERFNWHYRPIGVDKAFTDFTFFQSGEINWGDKSRLVRRRGVMDVRQFRRGSFRCFAFFMLFGVNGESGEPNHQLRGYYCQRSELNAARIETVVDTIGYEHERFGFAAKTPAGAGAVIQTRAATGVPPEGSGRLFTVPLSVVWDDADRPLRGLLTYRANGRTGTVNAAASTLRCKGAWKLQAGKYGSAFPPQGTWTLTCSDGRSAAGGYTSSAPGVGQGRGLGSDLKPIRFAFGEERRPTSKSAGRPNTNAGAADRDATAPDDRP